MAQNRWFVKHRWTLVTLVHNSWNTATSLSNTPFSFAGLLRLARFCTSHHNSVRIGLSPMIKVVSFSRSALPPFGMHIVWHTSAHKSTRGVHFVNWRKQMSCNIYTDPCLTFSETCCRSALRAPLAGLRQENNIFTGVILQKKASEASGRKY